MIHFLVSGDVQGVGFRQYTRYKARKLNIKGWVKNLPDGRVEGVIAGNPDNLQKMIKIVKNGPPIAVVHNIEISELPDQNFESFEIIKE